MDANVARFRKFLGHWVSPSLRDRGFRGSGQRLAAERGVNTVFIAFQRRAEFFTCDIGIVSSYLAATSTGLEPPDHYRIRLGPIAVGYDKWWDLEEAPQPLAEDFLAALAKGFDYIEAMSSDQGLREAILRDAARDPRGLRPFEVSMIARLEESIDLRESGQSRGIARR